jgi:hypothetical protein
LGFNICSLSRKRTTGTNKLIPAGSGQLSATLHDVVWAGAATASLAVPTSPVNPDVEVDILISSNFDVFVDIFISGDETKTISQIKFSISNARAHMRAESNVLLIEGSEFKTQRSISRLHGADALLAAAGIDPLEAAYVEGHIGYGVVSQAVANALGQKQ